MAKRTLIIIVIFLAVAFAATGVWYFLLRKRKVTSVDSALRAIPADALFIADIRDPFNTASSVFDTQVWQNFATDSTWTEFQQDIEYLDSAMSGSEMTADLFSDRSLYVSLHPSQGGKPYILYTFLVPRNIKTLSADRFIQSLTDHEKVEKIGNKEPKIRMLRTNKGKNLYYCLFKGFFAASQDLSTVEKSISQSLSGKGLPEETAFMSVYDKGDSRSALKVYLRAGNITSLLPWLQNELLPDIAGQWNAVTDGWLAFDIGIREDQVQFSGMAALPDTSVIRKILASQETAIPQTWEWIPTEHYFAATYHTSYTYHTGNGTDITDELCDGEYSIFYTPATGIPYSTQLAFLSHTPEKIFSWITDSSSFVYKKYTISKLVHPSDKFVWPHELFNDTDTVYFITEESQILFSSTREGIQRCIDAKITGLNYKYESGETSPLHFRINIRPALLASLTGEEAPAWLQKISAATWSIELKSSTLQIKGNIKTGSQAKKLLPFLKVPLDLPLASGPHPWITPKGELLGIIVQDTMRRLIFIDTTGSIRWKRQLDDRVLGKPEYVYVTDTKTAYFVISTPNFIYMTDADGKDASAFPFAIDGELTTSITVAKYPDLTSYRIFYAYDLNGKYKIGLIDEKGETVPGWNYTQTESPLFEPMRYVRLNGRDYILLVEDAGIVHLMDRSSKNHIIFPHKVSRARNSGLFFTERLSVSECYLSYSLESGMTVKVFLDNGKDQDVEEITPESVLLSPGITPGTSYYLSESQVVKWDEKKRMAEFYFNTGNPDGIDLHLLRGNQSIVISDTRSELLYMLDNEGRTMPGFPVKGGIMGTFTDVDAAKYTYLMFSTSASELICYRVTW